MPRNGTGTFVRHTSLNTGSSAWQLDRDAGATILASNHDTHDQELADEITNSIACDGQSVVTADIPMSNNKFTGMKDGAANTDSATYLQAKSIVAQATIYCAYNAAETIAWKEQSNAGATLLAPMNHCRGGTVMSRACTITRLQITGVANTGGAGATATVKIYKNGVDTTVSAAITCTDSTTYKTAGANCSIACAQGDVISFTYTGSGATAVVYGSITALGV